MKLYFLIILCATFISGCATTHHQTLKQQETAKLNVQLGLGYLQENKKSRAKQKLLMALQEAPNLPETQLAMGYFLMTQHELSLANNYYQKAYHLKPHSTQIQNDYGVFLCINKHYAQAMHYLLLAAENPNYTKQSEAYENAGLCALHNHHIKTAKKYFKKALLYDAKRQKSLRALARIASKSNQTFKV